MIHFCMMGGHKGQLASDKMVYITIFGSCELKQLTLSKQIIEMRRRRGAGLPVRRRNFFINIFGAASIKLPTLAEEYLDLQDALRSGLLSIEEYDAAVPQLCDESAVYGSFTFCGGFDANGLPDEKEEIEGLALNRHLGHIPGGPGKTLELGVGQCGASRTSILRQALAAAAPPCTPAAT